MSQEARRGRVELIDYVRMLARRWVWIAGFTLLGVVLALTWVRTTPNVYGATATDYVGSVLSSGDGSVSGDPQSASQFVLDRMPSYSELVDSAGVAESVIKELKLSMSVDDFSRHVTATSPTNTVILKISATDSKPARAADIANATAARLGAAIEDLEGGTSGLAPVKVTTLGVARPHSTPVSPNLKLALALGIVVGLGIGLLAASLRDQFAAARIARERSAEVTSAQDTPTSESTPAEAEAEAEADAVVVPVPPEPKAEDPLPPRFEPVARERPAGKPAKDSGGDATPGRPAPVKVPDL